MESIKKNIWIVYGNALFGIDCRLFDDDVISSNGTAGYLKLMVAPQT